MKNVFYGLRKRLVGESINELQDRSGEITQKDIKSNFLKNAGDGNITEPPRMLGLYRMNYWNLTKKKVSGTEELLEEKRWEVSKYDLRDQTINLDSVDHKNQDKYKTYTHTKDKSYSTNYKTQQ